LNWVKKSFCGCSRRAVKDTDKAMKRQELLQVAAGLFLKKDFSALSMDDVATTAKVAKGTLYLYFKTKEELALGVLTQDTSEWLDALHDYLTTTPKLTPQIYAAWMSAGLRARPRYLKFMPISALILEKNISKDAAREFKLMVAEQLNRIAPLLQAKLNLASDQQAARFLMQTHALVMGLHPCCFPNPVIAAIIVEENLGLFNNDFFEILENSLITLLLGYQQQNKSLPR
jgi:TetR/AcrR family transcriptional regulator